jgi:hypothetical protein
MFNILIDNAPKSYKGYLINWKFYHGILIYECMSDKERFSNDENGEIQRLCTVFKLLYGNGVPPFDLALEGLKWFIYCGAENTAKSSKNEEKIFSFEYDKERIFSAFMVKYGINLNKTENLHWFEFIALMNDLNKTAFRNITNLRMMKPKDMKGFSKEQKAEIMRQKKIFSIKKVLEKEYTAEQKTAIDNFDRLIGLKHD